MWADAYSEIWERFLKERRLEFGGHTDPTWREGHAFSASLVIPLEASRFRERIEPLREALRPFPFVSLHPDHFMHITVVLLGFITAAPRAEGEVSRERLAEIEKDARRVLAHFPPFTVRLANLNAFSSAAFVEVHDGGMVAKLREALCGGCGLKKPTGPPHLTLAYIQVPDGTPVPEALVSAIASHRVWPIGELTVSTVEMTLLDLRLEHPEPQVLAEMPLKGAVSHQQSATS